MTDGRAGICRACVTGLDVDGAGISVRGDAAAHQVLCASDPTMTDVEDLQAALGEGPCVDAARSARPVLVPDLRDVPTDRWPLFTPAVLGRTGAVALFALPLRLGAIDIGVLDLYRATPGPMPGAEFEDVLHSADTAALLLLDVRTHPVADFQSEQVWSERAEVHQATGMLIAQLGLSSQDALARLRAWAFTHDRSLIEVANDVVSRRLRFTETME